MFKCSHNNNEMAVVDHTIVSAKDEEHHHVSYVLVCALFSVRMQ